MKKLLLFLSVACCCATTQARTTGWQEIPATGVPAKGEMQLKPDIYKVFELSNTELTALLNASVSSTPEEGTIIKLPTPDGNLTDFRVWRNTCMAPQLAAKYPMILTFTAEAVNNRQITAKLDLSPRGFHALVFNGDDKTYLIDPYSRAADGYYLCYYKRDYYRPLSKHMTCALGEVASPLPEAQHLELTQNGLPKMAYRLNGVNRHQYRLALSCTGEYAQAVGGPTPTKATVLAAMVTSMNRVNGVYEREIAVTMQMVANEDTLITLDPTGEPFDNNNGGTLLDQNQTFVDDRIGTAGYDIGHIFSTGGGGIAQLGCVCNSNSKAMGVTGSDTPVGDAFDIDYVAHEMGHQFDANHTFNNNNAGSCAGNAHSGTAYEPGSGTTIMAYAGICGGGNDIQQHSDAYFHSVSLKEINTFLTTGGGNTCGVGTISTNTNAVLPLFSATYSIPYLTPFELTSPAATDLTQDTLTYCWEEWDRGDFGQSIALTRLKGPIFRSFSPVTSQTRVFPALPKVLLNVASYLGEKLPDTARRMVFKVTERDIYQGWGCFNFPDDTIHLDAVVTPAIFGVLTPNTAVNWLGGSQQTVTWEVANTTATPINATNVDIYMSRDGGYTWPDTLAFNTANDGTETITVPNIANTLARVKVKGHGNVFFDVSNTNFSITPQVNGIANVAWASAISVFPSPATNQLTIRIAGNTNTFAARITNSIGQQIWNADITGNTTLPVSAWSRGIYYLQLINKADGTRLVKPIMLN